MTDEIKKFKVGDRVKHSMFEWEAVVKHMRDNGSFKISDHQLWYYPEYFELVESPQKPTVPSFVDEFIKKHQRHTIYIALQEIISPFSEEEELKLDNKLVDWVTWNSDKFAQAWIYGYEVEEEPLYYVKLPNAVTPYLHKYVDSGEVHFFNKICPQTDLVKYSFTESEIKAIDERYWAFAVRVEEDE